MFELVIKAESLKDLMSKVADLYFELHSTIDESEEKQFGYDSPPIIDQKKAEEIIQQVVPPVPVVPPKIPDLAMPSTTPRVQPIRAEIQDAKLGHVEVDSSGKPWDETIHSASKTKTSDGLWRTKRGAGKAAATPQVAVVPVAPIVPPPVPMAPIAQPVFTPNIPVVTTVALPLSDIPIPQDTKPAHSLDTFKANLVPCLADLVNKEKITADYLSELTKYFEVKNIWEIAKNEEKVSECFETFVAAGLITKVG